MIGSGVSLLLMRSGRAFDLGFEDFAMDFGDYGTGDSSLSTFSDLQMSAVHFEDSAGS